MGVERHILIALLAACSPVGAEQAGEEVRARWPSFRGAQGAGVADGHPLPAQWSLETGDGIRWTASVPGLGHSSPVLWDGRLFLTTAVGPGEAELTVRKGEEHAVRPYGWIKSLPAEEDLELRVLCFGARDGDLLWSRTVYEGAPFSKRHPAGTHANASVAVDAERVVAWFGAEGLHAFDHEGNELWSRELGPVVGGYYKDPAVQWGVASSPVLHDGRVVLLCDVLKDPFLAAFDAGTGEDLWHTQRYDVPTWGSPLVVQQEELTQVVVNGYDMVGGYDLETGEEIWSMAGGGAVPIPTPVAAHGRFYVTSAGGVPGGRGAATMRAPILAIRDDAEGVVTVDNHVDWFKPTGGNYMSSPLIYGDELYCVTGSVLTCYDAHSGEEHYRRRIGSPRAGFAASPVAGDGKVYLPKDDGSIHVIAAGPEFESLSENPLGADCMATPAIGAGVLFFRTRDRLIAVDGTKP